MLYFFILFQVNYKHIFKDDDGFITKDELENIMGGIAMDEDTWKAILLESDFNNDGRVF